MLNKCTNDFWKFLKHLFPNSNSQNPHFLTCEGIEISEHKEMGNAFNNFFTNIVSQYIKQVNNNGVTHDHKLRDFISKNLTFGKGIRSFKISD